MTTRPAVASEFDWVGSKPRVPISLRARKLILPALCAGAALTLIAMALFAPVFAPHDPQAQSLVDRLHPPAWSDGGD